jgi:hypothetical protein
MILPSPPEKSDCDDVDCLSRLTSQFEDGWEPEAPEAWERIVELSSQVPERLVSNVIQELIAVDVQMRLAQKMPVPDPNTYLRQFPELAADSQWEARVRDNICHAVASTSKPSEPVDAIGRFRVINSLTKGGEADVYLCSHPQWYTQVVVKVETPKHRPGVRPR